MSRLSLRLRLTLAFALAMAVLLTAAGLFLHWRLADTLDEQIDAALRARAADLTAQAQGGGTALGEAGALAEPDENVAQVIGPDGEVVDATPPLESTPLLTADELARAREATVVVERGRIAGLDEERFRLLGTPAGEEVVVVGASLGDRDEALEGLRNQLLIGGPIALLLASLLGYALATAALRPVEAMRRQAEEISATTAGRRLPVPAADDEIARLARTLNEMLARLEAGLARERRFVADASHELRTPLALLKAELDLALRRERSPEELRASIASAAEETDRLVRLANDLLVLASADEGRLRLRTEPLDLRGVLDDVAGRFEGRARAEGRTLEVDVPAELVVQADRLRLEQALGNLVDNALRYGAGTVRLAAASENGSLALRVSDEGPGFPPEYLPHAFDRFSRAPDARSGSSAGLGLALVREIARAHGGTASAENDDGATVVVLLPT